jgi:hypothetical protein
MLTPPVTEMFRDSLMTIWAFSQSGAPPAFPWKVELEIVQASRNSHTNLY